MARGAQYLQNVYNDLLRAIAPDHEPEIVDLGPEPELELLDLVPVPLPGVQVGNLMRAGDALRLALELVGIAVDAAEAAGAPDEMVKRIRQHACAIRATV